MDTYSSWVHTTFHWLQISILSKRQVNDVLVFTELVTDIHVYNLF